VRQASWRHEERKGHNGADRCEGREPRSPEDRDNQYREQIQHQQAQHRNVALEEDDDTGQGSDHRDTGQQAA
jgi:hypothetical protein